MHMKTTLLPPYPKANAGEGVQEETLDTAGNRVNNTATIVTSRKASPKKLETELSYDSGTPLLEI